MPSTGPPTLSAGTSGAPGKAELLTWLNRLLYLHLNRLEQLGSGAVLCQVMDAYFAGAVPMHKVNFWATTDNESLVNWKLLQAAFNKAEVTRDVDVPRLSSGTQAAILELLQWLHKFLSRRMMVAGYNPEARRALSVRGGTTDVPIPSACEASSFDSYGRPMASPRANSARTKSTYVPSAGRIDVSHVTSKWRDGLAPPVSTTPGSRRRYAAVPTASGSSTATTPNAADLSAHLRSALSSGTQTDIETSQLDSTAESRPVQQQLPTRSRASPSASTTPQSKPHAVSHALLPPSGSLWHDGGVQTDNLGASAGRRPAMRDSFTQGEEDDSSFDAHVASAERYSGSGRGSAFGAAVARSSVFSGTPGLHSGSMHDALVDGNGAEYEYEGGDDELLDLPDPERLQAEALSSSGSLASGGEGVLEASGSWGAAGAATLVGPPARLSEAGSTSDVLTANDVEAAVEERGEGLLGEGAYEVSGAYEYEGQDLDGQEQVQGDGLGSECAAEEGEAEYAWDGEEEEEGAAQSPVAAQGWVKSAGQDEEGQEEVQVGHTAAVTGVGSPELCSSPVNQQGAHAASSLRTASRAASGLSGGSPGQEAASASPPTGGLRAADLNTTTSPDAVANIMPHAAASPPTTQLSPHSTLATAGAGVGAGRLPAKAAVAGVQAASNTTSTAAAAVAGGAVAGTAVAGLAVTGAAVLQRVGSGLVSKDASARGTTAASPGLVSPCKYVDGAAPNGPASAAATAASALLSAQLPPDAAALLASALGFGSSLLPATNLEAMGGGLDTAEHSLAVVGRSMEQLGALLGATAADPGSSPLSRGKLRSLEDAVGTLLRHTSLLLADVAMQCAQRLTQPVAAGGGDAAGEAVVIKELTARTVALRQQLTVHEATFAALVPRIAAASEHSSGQELSAAGGAGSGSSPTKAPAVQGVADGAAASPHAAVRSSGAGGCDANVAPLALNTGALDAALKAVGLAQFALVQGIHREISRLTALFLAGADRQGEGAATPATATATTITGVASDAARDSAQPTAGQATQAQAVSVPAHATGGPPEAKLGDKVCSKGSSRAFKLGEYQLKQLRNGDVYKGRYVGSRKEGDGCYHFVNGDVYEGEFRDDRMDGVGVYTFSHEGRYEGGWRAAVYAGAGTETFAKGSTYHGLYAGGLRNGWGVCRFYQGDYYEGQWARGLRDGRGMQQCTDESHYVGDYARGKRHGHGVYVFPNGDRYAGQYADDLPHGHGVYSFAGGQRYEGEWRAGRKHGWSIYTVESGMRWVAQWADGKPQSVQPLEGGGGGPDGGAAAAGLVVEGSSGGAGNDSSAEQLEAAVAASSAACTAAEVAAARVAEHWAPNGAVQPPLRAAVAAAERAASQAQAARNRALELGMRLDLAVALVREGRPPEQAAAVAGVGHRLLSLPAAAPSLQAAC